MKRPCGCDSCVIGEPLVEKRDCRLCWLYWNHPGYRRLWTEPASNPRGMNQPQTGPGTELKKLLAEMGISDFAGCSCNAKAAQMNEWGVDGCRAHYAAIRKWIVEAQAKAPWFDEIRAAVNVARGRLPIDLTDIAGSLVKIAIQRASEHVR